MNARWRPFGESANICAGVLPGVETSNRSSSRAGGARRAVQKRQSHHGRQQKCGHRRPDPRCLTRASWQRGVQKQADVADVAQALARILLETVLEEWPYTGRHAVQVRFVLDDVRKDVSHLVALEQLPAREHFVEDHAECPDVGAAIDRLASRLLGTHIGGRAEHDAGARLGGCRDRRRVRHRRPACARRGGREFRDSEVQHLHRPIGSDLDVRGLEIAVDDPLLVRSFERLGDLLRDRQCLVEWDRSSRDAL